MQARRESKFIRANGGRVAGHDGGLPREVELLRSLTPAEIKIVEGSL
jgi:hypothetical protein